jgi:uncharacterized protein YggE
MDVPVPPPQVVVRGAAMLRVDPEIAELAVTVTGRARDRQTALERCRARQDEVRAVLTAAGEAVETVETTGLSVQREIRDRRADGDPVASVHTRVTVGRLDAVGDLAVALGRLDDVAVAGPWWQLRADSAVFAQARLAAVREAVHRARQYASAFGSELAALLEISDAGLSTGRLEVAGAMGAMGTFGDDELSLDLTPARQEVHGVVEVRFVMSAPDQEVFRG